MGKIGSIKLKDNVSRVHPSAIRLFTDREDPQEAFERKYRVIAENLDNDAFAVLCYYGIGGIGKTTLLNRLCHVMDGAEDSPRRILSEIDGYHISFDFGAEGLPNDKMSILMSLRNQLVNQDAHFNFFLFDMAIALFAKKTGVNLEKDQSTSFVISQNPWIEAAVAAVGAVPVLGWVSNALTAMDMVAAQIKGAGEKKRNENDYEEDLKEMYFFEPSEILEHLQAYFIKDMQKNMYENVHKPLVVFLDTFEKYNDTMNNDAIVSDNDYWLRKGPDSLIQSIPGVLWVIMGRERLKWASDDSVWGEELPEQPLSEMTIQEKEELATEMLEQHLLGDLSEKDALLFLHKSGLSDDELNRELFKLTNGTPLFLDLCVHQYNSLCKDRKPVITDFGADIATLINRYYINMPIEYREIAAFLSIIKSWTNELIEAVVSQIDELDSFTEKRYEDFINHSFVISDADGNSYIHETVRAAFFANADNKLKYSVRKALLDYFEKKIEDRNSVSYSKDLFRYVDALLSDEASYEEVYSKWRELSEDIKWLDDELGLYEINRNLLAIICKHFHEKYPSSSLEMFANILYAETVVLLCRKHIDAERHVDVTITTEDGWRADKPINATYTQIKEWVAKNYEGMNVSSLYIAQVKEKHGLKERENYNKGKEGARVPQCTAEKMEAIEAALRYFKLI